MAFMIQAYTRVAFRVDNTSYHAGSMETPVSINVANEIVFQRVYSIATATNTLVYNDDLANFEFLYIAADFNTRLELTDGNSDTFSINLLGTATSGKYGLPFILGSDVTTNSTSYINTCRVYNTSGSTANVFVLAAD